MSQIEDKDPTRIDLRVDPREQRFRGTAIHGDTPFDVAYISHVMDNLWQGGWDFGLEVPFEIKHVISLYPWGKYKAAHELSTHKEVRAYDSADEDSIGGMTEKEVLDLAAFVNECRADAPTLVHCQAGLNRSGLIAATALVLNGDVASGAEAIALLREKRSPAVLCNKTFEHWVRHQFPEPADG